MALHRFTVNIPNPSEHVEAVDVALERGPLTELTGALLDVPADELNVTSAWLSLDPCAHHGAERLHLTLEARSSVDVHAIIDASAVNPAVGGAAVFHVIDRRAGGAPRGVTAACVERPGPEPPGKTITPANPCKLAATAPYPIAPGADVTKIPLITSILAGSELELVVPITNPTSTPLEDVHIYLEHLGGSDVEFVPNTWNAGTLAPGDVFYATWPLYTLGAVPGTFHPSVVVVSRRADPIRLTASIHVVREHVTGHHQ